jgi:large subunit ribosomal protein L1
MGRIGKNYRKARETAATKPLYPLPEALEVVTKSAFAKFDETVEVALRLGVDPKHADQMVRGTVILPHGLGGKAKRVLVIATGEKAREAEEAGADHIGGDDVVQRIQEGWLDFDAVVATPEMTAIIHAPIGKVSFGREKLVENAKTLIDSVLRARPAAAKGRYVKSIALSSTMGPGVRVDLATIEGHA